MARSGRRRGIFGWLWVVTKWTGVGLVAVTMLAAVLWYLGAPPREDFQSQMIELLDKRLGTSRRDATKMVHSLGAEAKKVLAEANDAAEMAYEQERASAPDGSMKPWLDLVWMEAAYKPETDVEKRRTAAARAAYERLMEMGFIDRLRTFREFDCIVSPNIQRLHGFDLYTPSLLFRHIISPARVRWEDAIVRGDEREVLESARDHVHLVMLFASQGHMRSISFANGQTEHLNDTLVRLGDRLTDLSPGMLRELLTVFGDRPPVPTPSDVAAMSLVELRYSIVEDVRRNNKRIEMILMRIVGEPRRLSRIAKNGFAASTSYIEAQRRGRPSIDDIVRSTDQEVGNFASGPISHLRDSLDVAEVLWSGIRVQIALACYHAEHGEYPETLDALVPAILPTLPQDMFAAAGSFRYRRIDPSQDRYGRGYLLWSVGGDGIDNNGTMWESTSEYDRRNQPSKALNARNEGVDYVLNMPIEREGVTATKQEQPLDDEHAE